MFAEHRDPLCKALLHGTVMKTGRVRHREAKEFAKGHTAPQGTAGSLSL